MRSYDHKHPKGRKFSEAELVAHRDKWYAKYAAAGGTTALPERKELDRALFKRLLERLPYKGIIAELRNRYGGQPLTPRQLDPLAEYLEDCRDPSFEFLDADLEAARAALSSAAEAYNEKVLTHVFVDDKGTRLLIQPGMKYHNPDMYYPLVHEISRLEAAVVDAYGEMVKLGRRKLGIDANVV